MGYYKTCDYCDNHLDPGEKCDCPGATAARLALQAEDQPEPGAEGEATRSA